MKSARISIVILAAALFALGIGTSVFAFHDGGVADCAGCHSMHSAADNNFSAKLLIGSDPSSTCLSCHASSASTTGPSSKTIFTNAAGTPVQRGPGGDFAWLKKTFTFSGHGGTTETEDGATHGHNVVARDFSLTADPVNTSAPGGAFATELSCASCHDPHGKNRRLVGDTIATTGAPIIASGSRGAAPGVDNGAVGVYRILRKLGGGVPQAVSPRTYNKAETTTQVRIGYGKGTTTGHTTWSNWCSSCHGEMHTLSTTGEVHPVDEGLNGLSTNYTTYISSGKVGTGVPADYAPVGQGPFTSLVPFVETGKTYAELSTRVGASGTSATYLSGPSTSDEVMCLSCHRAHASGWKHAVRWNPEGGFLTELDNTGVLQWSTEMGRTVEEATAGYYDRKASTFGAFQRNLCNKCHVQD